jgi:hypothetical protein
MFEAFWPHALDVPNAPADPHGSVDRPEMRDGDLDQRGDEARLLANARVT